MVHAPSRFTTHICFPGSDLVTVLADDRDMRGSPNSTFHYELKSVSPKTENAQFFIDKDNGTISFKGCLDHEASGFTFGNMTCLYDLHV